MTALQKPFVSQPHGLDFWPGDAFNVIGRPSSVSKRHIVR
jgi:hypothetical protein